MTTQKVIQDAISCKTVTKDTIKQKDDGELWIDDVTIEDAPEDGVERRHLPLTTISFPPPVEGWMAPTDALCGGGQLNLWPDWLNR